LFPDIQGRFQVFIKELHEVFKGHSVQIFVIGNKHIQHLGFDKKLVYFRAGGVGMFGVKLYAEGEEGKRGNILT
jgi:hypothetical protein